MTPETGAGWFPRMNRRGQIVCGNVEIFVGVSGSWLSLGAGNTPYWLSESSVVFNDGAQAVLVDSDGSNRRVVDSGGFNEMSAALTGRWNGFRAPATVVQYQDTTPLSSSTGVGLVQLSPNGQHSAYVDQPQANIKNLYVDNAGVATSEVMSYSVGDTGVCWLNATGTYTRQVMGYAFGQSPADWSVRDWEAPQIIDGPAGLPWVLSNTQTGIVLRAGGSTVGYERLGDFYYPSGLYFPESQQFAIVSSDAAGRLQTTTIALSEPMIPLTGTTVPPVPPIPPIPPIEVPMVLTADFVNNHPARAVLGQGANEHERRENALRFCNTVARDANLQEGSTRYGLLSKESGANAFGYAADIIFDYQSADHFDVVKASESADAAPSFQNHGQMDRARWRATDPRYYVGGPVEPPAPGPVPPVPPIPPVPGEPTNAQILAAVQALQADFDRVFR